MLGGKQTTNDGTPNEEEVKVGTGLIRLLPENVRDELSHKLRKTGVVALDFRILDSEWANLPWEACIHADWSEFKIIEIPDDVNWHVVKDYDNDYEYIEEIHKIWS